MPDNQFLAQVGTYTSATNVAPLGHEVSTGIARYRWVKFLDAVTYVVGHVVGPASTSTYHVTNDVAGGSALGLRYAGCIPNVDQNGNTVTAVPTQNQFGYVQLDGWHSAVFNDGTDYAAGDTAAMVATDGATVPIAAATTTGTLIYVGWCPAIITATSGRILLRCFIW